MANKTINKVLLRQEQNEMDQIVVILLHTIAERSQPQKRVLDLLAKLQLRVVAHLKDDEPFGVVGQRTRAYPELARECDALCQTHSDLRDHFDRIMQLAAQNNIDSEWWDELELQFHGLCVKIGHYLSGEQKLLEKIHDDF